ncbi:glutamine synthetase family protein [Elusimicrobiota bacterium]
MGRIKQNRKISAVNFKSSRQEQVEEVLKTAKTNDVRFIRLWFVDILGQLKSFTITSRELERALADGMGFDGSSIEGFARIYESDLVVMPDPSTFHVLPRYLQETTAARMFCDIVTPEKKPYPGDTRNVLKENLRKAKDIGFDLMVGPELEYFYFKNNKIPEVLDAGGYFDSVPVDVAHDLRQDTVMMLEKMGIHVEYSHHEVAPSQHEIDLRYDHALAMADNVITYKHVVKQVAESKGCYATFMPKPLAGLNGSGMHVHQSLFKSESNAFFNSKDDYNLSENAKHYIAGILKHAREICAVTNQWVNSYKRLIPGFEAPVYICWARKNRSSLVRVPQHKIGKEEAVRIECRFPDPACNPYLAFSVMLAAGLEGIKKKYPLPEPLETDVYHMNDIERKAKGVDTMPGSLIEAIELVEQSDLVKKALGDHVFEKFVENKRIEWENYRKHVSDYEVERYLPML